MQFDVIFGTWVLSGGAELAGNFFVCAMVIPANVKKLVKIKTV